jgi:hypothetical protein
MFVQPELRGSTAIFAFEGWNDAGESATSALGCINDSIKTAPLAEIDPEIFYDFTVTRPEVEIVVHRDYKEHRDHKEHGDHNGHGDHNRYGNRSERKIRWPGNAFRYGTVGPANELVTCIGVEPHLRWRCFCDCVGEILKSVGVERVIMLGSYLADVVYSQPVQITGRASDPLLLERIGVQTSSYQGPTGILGVLGDRFQQDGFEVVSLWAALPHYINACPNPRGALALARVVTDCLGLPLDLEPLERAALEFEERISKLVSRDSELRDYVKQLKRREFAQ